MEKKYLTVKEIWDFINKIIPGAIPQKDGNYSLKALECLFFVTENQGKRLNSKSIVKPRHKEWWDNRERLKKERVAEKCKGCSEGCELKQCCMHPKKEPPESFKAQLTFVLECAIVSIDFDSSKYTILKFLNEKKFQNASRKIQKLDQDEEVYYKKMAEIIVELIDWKEANENTQAIQKIKSDFQQQKKQLLQFRGMFESLGRKYSNQWWREIAEILVSTTSEYDDNDMDIREENAQDAEEEGNYKKANSILSNSDWKDEIKLLDKLLEEERARCRRYISGQRHLIRNLCADSPSKGEIIKIYEEILHLSEEYQIEYTVFQEYSEFLYSQKEYDKGIEIAKRLNQHYKARKWTQSADIAKLYILFGKLYYAVHDFEESIHFCNEAEKILEKDPYRYVTERVRVYNTMSDNYWRIHSSNKARKYANEALKLIKQHDMSFDQLTDQENLDVAHTYKRLATLFRREWDLDEAEKYYGKSLEIEEKLSRKDQNNDEFSQAVAETCNNLGIVYRHMKRYKEGEKYYKKSFDIRQKKYFCSNDLTFNWNFAMTATNYAYLLACAGRLAEAETKMEEIALPIKEMLLEKYPDSKKYQSSYALSLKDYAFALSCADSDEDGKWEKADTIFLESANFVEEHLTKDSKIPEAYEYLTATLDFEYGCLLQKMGKKPEAIYRFQKSLDGFQALGENSRYYVHDIVLAALELAELLSENKDTWAEAELAYTQSLEFGEKIPKASQKYYQEEYTRTLNSLIDMLQLQGCPENQLKIKTLKEKLENIAQMDR